MGSGEIAGEAGQPCSGVGQACAMRTGDMEAALGVKFFNQAADPEEEAAEKLFIA
jgi:hypothetical protein